MSSAHAVVVVGGGIAGLVAATRMVAAGAEVTLLESSDRVGGSVRTAPFAGRALDMGAETVVTAQPEAVQLCEELGLGDDLVASGREPGFLTLRHGLGTLTGALAQTLLTAGADVRVATAATAVSPEASGGVTVVDEHGTELHADACIIATPARPAARMLAQSVPVAAAGLERLTASSVAVVALAYPATALHGLPAGTGFPTTSGQTRLVRAWTWSSAKWHHLAGELALVKAFIGRAGAPPPPVELASLAHAELARALGLQQRPVATLVERFGGAIPGTRRGTLRALRESKLLPARVQVAGAAYRGAGIPACVRSGQAAADRLLERLGLTRPTRSS